MRDWNWRRIATWTAAAVLVGYLVVIPTIGLIVAQLSGPKTGEIPEMSFAERVRLQTTQALTAGAFFAIGAAVGSFLNVVVYRAPRGISVAFQRSRCPTCGSLIEGRHNVPIIGWLVLKGQCSACASPISIRYPTVEAIAGSLFLLLYFVELISGGDNLPVRRPNAYDGVVWIIFYTKWDLVGLYVFHCLGVSALLTWALIDVDRQRIPGWLPAFAAAWLAGLPAILPHLLPVTCWGGEQLTTYVREWSRPSAVATSLAGGLVGALFGWVTARVIERPRPDAESEVAESSPVGGHTTSAGMIVGLSLGWQAAVGVWLVALAIRPITIAVARGLTRSAPPITTSLLVAFMIQLIGWRWSYATWWPSGVTSYPAWAMLGILFATLSVLNRFIPTPQLPTHGQVSPALPGDPLIDLDRTEGIREPSGEV